MVIWVCGVVLCGLMCMRKCSCWLKLCVRFVVLGWKSICMMKWVVLCLVSSGFLKLCGCCVVI